MSISSTVKTFNILSIPFLIPISLILAWDQRSHPSKTLLWWDWLFRKIWHTCSSVHCINILWYLQIRAWNCTFVGP